MPTASGSNLLGWLLLGAAMVPIGGFFLQIVCNMCGADSGSFRRATLITLGVAAAAFFTFDGIGYGIVLATRDTVHLNLPPGYGYLNWLREPLYLKWQVMGLVPMLRYLPVAFAVCLAGTLYVLILKEPFRNCMVILLIQWTLNVVAMAVLAFLLSVTIGFVGHTIQPPTEPGAAAGSGLKGALATPPGEAGSSLNQIRGHLHALDESLGPYLEPIKTACQPYTQYLPPVVQEFLDDGGWWLVLAALGIVVVFWLRTLYRRLKRALFRKKKRPKKQGQPHTIDLDLVGDAFTDPGTHQIAVRGQTGRLRLVVLSPSSSYVGELLPEMAESLLDWLQPGLGDILAVDTPRVVVWPRYPSVGRFLEMFPKLVQAPETKGRRSPWMLLSGATRLGRQTIFLGLAVYLDKTTYTREIQVEKEKWNEILSVQAVSETV
jgi:hypothetical protein